MLAQQRIACHTRGHHAPLKQRPFASPPGRALQRPSPNRALPVPTSDVIDKTDADAMCTLEERFKMADIDG